MKYSKIGFGTYRISTGNKEHENSLKKALSGGVNLIDTSSNYTNGQSERLIGKTLKDLSGKIPRNVITIVSKYGYIQGRNMDRYMDGFITPETVFYQPNCYHCIHPDFMRDQLTRSLERLQTDFIDIYLIHNPEYYLMHSVHSQEEKVEHQEEMLRRIGEAFIALEDEVKKGRIKSYGISSNSFGKPEDDMHFIPYKGLIELAKKAAGKAGNEKHSFTTVQLPANLLEIHGLQEFVPWAHKNCLNVLINRPLNAFDGESMVRLASYEKPEYYEKLINQMITHFSSGMNKELLEFIREMDGEKTLFSSISHFENNLYRNIMPMLHNLARDADKGETALLNKFMDAYSQEVKHIVSRRTIDYLTKKDHRIEGPIQIYALKFLVKNPDITCVLLGMKQDKYVDDAFEVMAWHKNKNTKV